MMSTVPDDVLSCFLSSQIVLENVKKNIYDSFFWNSGNACAYDKVSPFPVWSSTDAGGVAWHKSQKAQKHNSPKAIY